MSDWAPYKDESEAISGSFITARVAEPTWSPAAILLATAIGWEESHFGITPDWHMPDGLPSYNWGAIMGSGTNGQVAHGDRDADGKPITAKFAAFLLPEDGFTYWASKLPPDAVAAMQEGNARAVAEALYAHCWFTGVSGNDSDRIDAYAKLLVSAAQHVRAQLAEPERTHLDEDPGTRTVTLGELKGLAMGACPWHDANKGKSPTQPKPKPSGGATSPSPWLVLVALLLLARSR